MGKECEGVTVPRNQRKHIICDLEHLKGVSVWE